MWILTVGSAGKVLAEMKQKKQQITNQIQQLNKELRKERKPEKENPEIPRGAAIKRIEGEIKNLTELKPYYSSKSLPAYVDGVVINLKAYHKFMKKLDGFEIDHVMKPDGLYVKHKNKRAHGMFYLKNQTDHYQGFIHIPEAIWRDE